MAQQAKVLATTPDDLRSTHGATHWKQETGSCAMSSDLLWAVTHRNKHVFNAEVKH